MSHDLTSLLAQVKADTALRDEMLARARDVQRDIWLVEDTFTALSADTRIGMRQARRSLLRAAWDMHAVVRQGRRYVRGMQDMLAFVDEAV